MQPIAKKSMNICFSGSQQTLRSLRANKQVMSFGRILSRAAASKIEANEQQLLNGVKPLLESVAAYNKQILKVPESNQIESLKRLQQSAPPELTILTAIGKRKLTITGLNISTMTQSSDADLAYASQQQEQRNVPWESHIEPVSPDKGMLPAGSVSVSSDSLTPMNRSATDDSASGSVPREVGAAEAPGTTAISTVPVNKLPDVVYRQPGNIDSVKADIFQCQTNYLELNLLASFDQSIGGISFSPMGKYLFIHGCDGSDDYSLKIWRQGADGNWLHNGEIRDSDSFRHYQLNRSENTLLSCSRNGNVRVSTLNSDGCWEEAVVLALTPSHENYPPMVAGFSPLQDKIMCYDPQTGKVNVLREDSHGRWSPVTRISEISHYQQTGPQQPPFAATDHYLLTYQGATATIWGFIDQGNCLKEKKVFECNRRISSAQLSDDEQHAVIFTWGNQAIFLGCDDDGNWSRIGENHHPESWTNGDNRRISNLIYSASFNGSGTLALTCDINDNVIVSGSDNNGAWVGKTEIQDCRDARFSPSGNKLLARLGSGSFKLWDYNNTGNQLNKGQSSEHNGSQEASSRGNKLLARFGSGSFKFRGFASSDNPLGKAQTLKHSGSREVIFSPSENLLLSYGSKTNFACIWGNRKGKLVEQARVYHPGGVDYAAFNALEDSVLTRGRDQTLKIRGLTNRGKSQEQLVVQHQNSITDAQFSSSGHFAYTVSLDDTACILGRDDNGQWLQQAVANSGPYSIKGARFNKLEHYFLVYGNNLKDKRQPGFVQLWGIGDDGTWVERERIKLEHPVTMAEFSPDDEHLVIHCNHDRGKGPAEAGTALLWKIPARE